MTRRGLYLLTLGLSAAGAVWLLWNSVAVTPAFCLFKEATGLPCPSCGATRSVVEIVHGHFLSALAINPFGYIDALLLLVLPFWAAADLLSHRDGMYRFYRIAENAIRRHRSLAAAGIVVVAANWCWNIVKGL